MMMIVWVSGESKLEKDEGIVRGAAGRSAWAKVQVRETIVKSTNEGLFATREIAKLV